MALDSTHAAPTALTLLASDEITLGVEGNNDDKAWVTTADTGVSMVPAAKSTSVRSGRNTIIVCRAGERERIA